jgi:hypothetical protein
MVTGSAALSARSPTVVGSLSGQVVVAAGALGHLGSWNEAVSSTR